jgi:hypothetical protein
MQLNGNDIESDNDGNHSSNHHSGGRNNDAAETDDTAGETVVDESLGKPMGSAGAEDGIIDKYPTGHWTVKMVNEDPEVQEAYHEYIEARVEALAKVNRYFRI